MELTKALDILKERMETNKVILNDKSHESDFDLALVYKIQELEKKLKENGAE